MKSRTKARSVALQALYELDLTDHGVGNVLASLLEATPLEKKQEEFQAVLEPKVSGLVQV